MITASTPYALKLDRFGGLWVVLASAVTVAAVDVLRFGPDVEPAAVGYLSVLPAWFFAYQLGVSWSAGRVGRRAAAGLFAGGLAVLVFLMVGLDYPVSIVTVPGSVRSNRLGPLPGLGDAPVDGRWIAARLAWYPLLALVLACIVVLVRRFENPVPAAYRASGEPGRPGVTRPVS